MRRLTKREQATAWCLLGEVGGLTMSSVLNGQQAATHGFGRGPVIVAMSIPIGLFIALRVVTTAPIEGRWRWLLWPGFALLVSVFAIVSFRDQRDLLTRWGFEVSSDGLIPLGTASLIPLGIDGVMAVCAVALLALAASRPPEPVANPDPQPEVETSAAEPIDEPVFIETPDLYDASDKSNWEFPDRALPEPEPGQPDWFIPGREPVDAETEARPARGTKSATRQEFEARLASADPMSPAEIQEKDGGTIRSAESKAYRWRKALQTEPVA